MAKVGAKFWQSKDPRSRVDALLLLLAEKTRAALDKKWHRVDETFRIICLPLCFGSAAFWSCSNRIAELGPSTECLARLTVSGLGRADSAAFASDSAGSVRLKYISSAFSASFGFRSLNDNGGEDPWKKEALRITHTLRLFCTWRLWARTPTWGSTTQGSLIYDQLQPTLLYRGLCSGFVSHIVELIEYFHKIDRKI